MNLLLTISRLFNRIDRSNDALPSLIEEGRQLAAACSHARYQMDFEWVAGTLLMDEEKFCEATELLRDTLRHAQSVDYIFVGRLKVDPGAGHCGT